MIITAMSIGLSVNGYPAGGDQQGAGEDWAIDSIANGCSCHMDEQLDEGMYMLKEYHQNTYLIVLTTYHS